MMASGREKEYNPQIGKLVEAMAAANFTQKRISELVPDVIRSDLDNKHGLYRADWERGLSLGSGQIINSYLKMASSGKCWGATKHWLAVKGGIVEPKEVIIETNKPDLSHLSTEQLAAIVKIANKTTTPK